MRAGAHTKPVHDPIDRVCVRAINRVWVRAINRVDVRAIDRVWVRAIDRATHIPYPKSLY